MDAFILLISFLVLMFLGIPVAYVPVQSAEGIDDRNRSGVDRLDLAAAKHPDERDSHSR